MTSRIPAVVLRQSKYVPKVEFVCVGKLLKDIMLLRFQLPLGTEWKTTVASSCFLPQFDAVPDTHFTVFFAFNGF